MSWYVDAIPPFLVKFFARPYVSGDSLAMAVRAAEDLLARRSLLTTLDLLAENIHTDAEVQGIVQAYEAMIDTLAGARALQESAVGKPTFSIKPSSFTTAPLEKGGDARGSGERVRALLERARQRGVSATIDMEDRHWTDWTLELARSAWDAGMRHVGIVLQTRLNRTRADLDTLPAGLRVRLVIGIYVEPAEVAIADKRQMKERLLEYGKLLLQRGHYLEFATHDEATVRRFLTEVVPATGAKADQFEVQMLYGVPRDAFFAELRAGKVGSVGPVRSRLYVPYALSWSKAIAYLRRRLRENPGMALQVMKNLPGKLLGR